MEYKKIKGIEIGNRIRTERKAKGLSQERLIFELQEKGCGIGRNTLCAIENGDVSKVNMEVLCALTQIFECDTGYLMCEAGYDNKLRSVADASNELGLNYKTVDTIKHYNDEARAFINYIANEKYEDSHTLISLLKCFYNYITETATEVEKTDHLRNTKTKLSSEKAVQIAMDTALFETRKIYENSRENAKGIRNFRIIAKMGNDYIQKQISPKDYQVEGQMDITQFLE